MVDGFDVPVCRSAGMTCSSVLIGPGLAMIACGTLVSPLLFRYRVTRNRGSLPEDVETVFLLYLG